MMTTPRVSVEVSAPSRLHFGLLSLGHAAGRQYGGAGVMIDAPRIVVRVAPDRELVVRYGPCARRAAEVAQTWSRRCLQRKQPPVFIEVTSEVAAHVGLGSGTQLSLALATALYHCFDIALPSASELANSVDRGERSAVGTHGFLHGGLIVEAGRPTGEPLSELAYHRTLPRDWRFVLLRAAGQQGRHGIEEQQAFGRMPPVAESVRTQLWRLLEEHIVPAVERSDLDAFGEHVYEYGVLSGEIFASEQGGAYAGDVVTELVSTIRELGIRGVGQSSWGPTVFAITPSVAAAQALESSLARRYRHRKLHTQIAGPDNLGAQVTILDAATGDR